LRLSHLDSCALSAILRVGIRPGTSTSRIWFSRLEAPSKSDRSHRVAYRNRQAADCAIQGRSCAMRGSLRLLSGQAAGQLALPDAVPVMERPERGFGRRTFDELFGAVEN